MFARGLLKPVLTRIYVPGEAGAEDADDGRATRDGRAALRFDVRLQGERETVFFEL